MQELDINGTEHELAFWRGFVKTPRFLNEWLPADVVPNDLQAPARDFFNLVLKPGDKVLDIGSGVVSLLRGTVPADDLEMADPLADDYATFFDYRAHGIKPPLRLAGEDINFVQHFDIIHCSNALDHTVNPIRVLQAMKRATKPGGYMVVQCFVNEGSWENWSGFHQWNIDIGPQRELQISNRQGGVVTHYEPDTLMSTVYINTANKKMLLWIVRI